MNRARVRKLLKFKTKSTTDLSAWNKNDEKLLKAVEASDLKKVNSILSKKTLVPNKLGPRGHSVFQIACASGNENIVDALLHYTDDVNDLTIQGNTALQLAAAKGHTGIVQKLLQANADVDMKDSNNMTALHHACAGLHLECVQALLSGNASPRSTEKTGKTSLFYAAHRGDIAICKWLVDKGSDVNTQDIYQVTPLMIAAKEGHREICEFLLRKGANPQSIDREGKTAMGYAVMSGHAEIREIFENAPSRASWDIPVPKYNEREVKYPDSTELKKAQIVNDQFVTSTQTDIVSRFQESPASNRMEDQIDHDTHDDLAEDLKRTASAPNLLSVSLDSSDGSNNKKLKELQEEHDQLNEEYHKLSIDNLKLRDKLEASEQRFKKEKDQGKGETKIPETVTKEINDLKKLLEEEKEKNQELTQFIEENKKTPPVIKKLGEDGWQESDDESGGSGNEDSRKMVVLLRSQILTLNQENDQLKERLQNLPNGYNDGGRVVLDQIATGVSLKDLEELNEKVEQLESEKQELQTQVLQLKEATEAEKLNGAITYEELISQKNELELQLQEIKHRVQVEKLATLDVESVSESKDSIKNNELIKQENLELKEELSRLKSITSVDTDNSQTSDDLNRLQTLLEEYKHSNKVLHGENSNLKEVLSKNVSYNSELGEQAELLRELTSLKQEVIMLKSTAPSSRTESDDSGDVEPVPASQKIQDTKDEDAARIEILENQNEKLQDQVTILSTELNKLRTTFDAILKAGDDLQEDFDQLQQEKEQIQAEYEKVMNDREEFTKENTYLLQDSNQMHDDLTKLVYELENLQEKYKTVIGEKEDLERKISAVSLAGKVGEVATLLEERDKLQQKYNDLEERSSTLQHDHDIVLEEVQSLQEQISQLSTQRDTMFEDLDEYEGMMQQHEILQQDYNQLEQDYTDLLKEKEKLEQELLEVQTTSIKIERTSATDGQEELIEENKMLTYEKDQLELTIEELSKANALLEEEILVIKKIQPELSLHKKLNNNIDNVDEEREKEIASLQSQISILKEKIDASEKCHNEVISMYRTHLVSAVQGHMDPDVHQALHQIIEIRSMEQFC